MKTQGYIYLASPYSDDDEAVEVKRFWAACAATARMMRSFDVVIFSPIAHSHCVALCGGIPKDWAFWKKYDEVMLSGAHQLWVLMLEGWEESVGVKAEIAEAHRLGLEISYFAPTEEDLKEYAPCIAAA